MLFKHYSFSILFASVAKIRSAHTGSNKMFLPILESLDLSQFLLEIELEHQQDCIREVYRISLKDVSREQDVLAHALSNIVGTILITLILSGICE